MKKFIALFIAVTFVILLSGPARSQPDADRIRQMVQAPIAVQKAVDAGMPKGYVEHLTGGLNRGNADFSTMNKILRFAPDAANKPGGMTGIGEFVTNQVNNGLRGQQLAEAIHKHLNELGIPAGGMNETTPPPIANNYLPERAKQNIQREASQLRRKYQPSRPQGGREAENRGKPAFDTSPGGVPGNVGGGSMGPGRGGPR